MARWAQGEPYATSAIPYIGENGNWWVNQEDTGVKAQGPEGKTGARGPAGIGAQGPAFTYDDLTEEQKFEIMSHITPEIQSIKDSMITEAEELTAEAEAYRNSSEEYYKQARSYTVGDVGYRPNESTDNAAYYYERVKHVAQGMNGLVAMGTITFSMLPTEGISVNAMYNISDVFTSDSRFIDGGGKTYGAGSNVYYTANGLWDVLAAPAVTGVKGEAETTFQQGNAIITTKGLGLDEQLKDTVPYNLIDTEATSGFVRGSGTYENGRVTVTKTSAGGQAYFCKDYFLEKGVSYTASAKCTTEEAQGGSIAVLYVLDNTKLNFEVLQGSDSGTAVNVTFTPTKDFYCIRVMFRQHNTSATVGTEITFTEMQLVKGTTVKPYRKPFDSAYELSEKLAVAYEDTFPQNLIPFPYHESNHTDNGIDWVVNDDGTITANNTAINASEFTISPRIGGNVQIILPAGTYAVSGCPMNGGSSKYSMNVIKTNDSGTNERVAVDYGDGATFTLDKETKVGVNFYIMKGQTVSNLTFKPMLVKGSKVRTYHRMFDSTYELNKKLEVAYEDTFPYNLIPFPYYAPSGVEANGIKWTYDESGIVTANGTSTATNASTLYVCKGLILKAGTYTAIGCPAGGGNTSTYRLRIGKDNAENTVIGVDTGSGFTFTLQEDTAVTVLPQIFSGYTASNVRFKPMIIKGSETKPYHRGFKSVYALQQYLTGTLTAGETTLTISDSSITSDSIIDIYTNVYGVSPSEVSVASGSITLVFDAQETDLGVKVRVM